MTRVPRPVGGMAAAAGLVLLALLVRLPLLDTPLERDEAGYALIARDLPRGRLPYRDAVDNKPPLLYAAYALLEAVAGADPARLRALGAGWNALTALAVWRTGVAVAGAREGLIAGLIYALASADPSVQGFTVNAELLMLLPAVLAALGWWHAIRRRSAPLAAAAGAGLGLAILLKQQALPQLLLVAFALAVPRRRRAAVALAFLGAAAGIGALALAGLEAMGILADARGVAGVLLRHIVSAVPLPRSLADLAGLLGRVALTQGPVWLLAVAGAGAAGWAPRGRGFVLGWLAAAAAGALLGRRPIPHYLLPLGPPLALLAGTGLARLLRPAPGARAVALLRVATGAAVLVSAVTLRPLLAAPRAVQARSLYPDNAFLEAEAVADWVAAHTPPDTPVWVAGSEPGIPLRAGRPLAGRYPYLYYLVVPAPGMEAAQDRWVRECADTAGVLVVCDVTASWSEVFASPRLVERLRGRVRAELASGRWRPAARIPPYRLYLRR
jgi:4-amino-4-deoxy-L-arabinose transferase-like glycosyltransferase